MSASIPRPAPTSPSPSSVPTAVPRADGSPARAKPPPSDGSSPSAGKWPSIARGGGARPVGSSFSPLDQTLHLGTEGYSPSVLREAVRQAGKAASFRDASDDLKELLQVSICPSHLLKLA